MNYEDMSDFEINEQVARLRFDVFAACHDGSRKNGSVRASGVEFDPCNNPSDAWSIIVENAISITSIGDLNWNADSLISIEESARDYNHFECISACSSQDKNPLRAAMICFLKMKDAQNKPCKKTLADGQWYKFCGEFDMDSAPALCVNCGGEFKLKDAEK